MVFATVRTLQAFLCGALHCSCWNRPRIAHAEKVEARRLRELTERGPPVGPFTDRQRWRAFRGSILDEMGDLIGLDELDWMGDRDVVFGYDPDVVTLEAAHRAASELENANGEPVVFW